MCDTALAENIRAHVFIATSEDGFIAKEDGDVEWLNEQQQKFPEGNDGGFGNFMKSVDSMIMGRKTFDQVLSFGPEMWPYGETAVFVLSRGTVVIPEHLKSTVSQMAGEPVEILSQLSKKGYRSAYVDGGNVIQDFLKAGLIHSAIITKVPVTLGSGIPLFRSESQKARLVLRKEETIASGITQSTFSIL